MQQRRARASVPALAPDRVLFTVGLLSLLFLISAAGYRYVTRPTWTPDAEAAVTRLHERVAQADHQFDAVVLLLGALEETDRATVLIELGALRTQAERLRAAVEETRSVSKEIKRSGVRRSAMAAGDQALVAVSALDAVAQAVEQYVNAKEARAARDPNQVLAEIATARGQIDRATAALARIQ